VSTSTRHEAAEILRRLVAAVERGELDAPAWLVERMRGAAVGLDVRAPRRYR
jgi:hypothetical protein